MHLYVLSKAGKLNEYPARLNFNISQKLILVAALANNYYLNQTEITEVAQQTGLSERSVRGWLSRRRFTIRCERKKGAFFLNCKTGNEI